MDMLLKIIYSIEVLLLLIYVYSMFICPFWEGNGSWVYVQDVWHRWQDFNAGVLLFISAIATLESTKYIQKKKNEVDQIAAKALLPEALSELSLFCKESAKLLKEAYEKCSMSNEKEIIFIAKVPDLPVNYKETFARCIALEEKSNESKYLAFILVRLQIINSRNKSLKSDLFETTLRNDDKNKRIKSIVPNNVISYIMDLGELKALIDRTFKYARGYEGVLNSNKLTWSEYCSAYILLDIDPELSDLKNYTQQMIEHSTDVFSI